MTYENYQTASHIAIFVGAIIAALGTFGTFYFSEKIKTRDSQNKISIYKSSFLLDCEKLIKPLDSQIEKIDSFVTNNNFESPNSSFNIIFNLLTLPDEIKANYKLSELNKSFGDSKDVHNLWQNVQLIEQVIKGIENEFKQFPVIVNQNKENYSQYILKIFEIRDKIINESKKNPSILNEHPFILEFFTACNDHMKVKDKYDLLFGKGSLIDPLYKINQKYVGDSYSNQVTPYLHSASNAYRNISKAKESFLDTLRKHSIQLREIKKNIESYLVIIKEK